MSRDGGLRGSRRVWEEDEGAMWVTESEEGSSSDVQLLRGCWWVPHCGYSAYGCEVE